MWASSGFSDRPCNVAASRRPRTAAAARTIFPTNSTARASEDATITATPTAAAAQTTPAAAAMLPPSYILSPAFAADPAAHGHAGRCGSAGLLKKKGKLSAVWSSVLGPTKDLHANAALSATAPAAATNAAASAAAASAATGASHPPPPPFPLPHAASGGGAADGDCNGSSVRPLTSPAQPLLSSGGNRLLKGQRRPPSEVYLGGEKVPTPGVAVLRKTLCLPPPPPAPAPPLKRGFTSVLSDSPRPALDPLSSVAAAADALAASAGDGVAVEAAAAPEQTPAGVSDPVRNGFDQLRASIQKVVSGLPERSLDARLVRVGRWVERFSVDQQPGAVAARLAPVMERARAETEGQPLPNLPLLASACAVLHQSLLLLNAMYPVFEAATLPALEAVLRAVYFQCPFDAAREEEVGPRPPLFLLAEGGADAEDDSLRRSILYFGGRTYFQAVRDVSKRLGQAVKHFDQQAKEREKMGLAMGRVISTWQLMFTGTLFRAWRAVKGQRVAAQKAEAAQKVAEAEKKAVDMRLRRVDAVVDEVRKEKNLEIQVLREGAKQVEEELKAAQAESKRLAERLEAAEARAAEMEEGCVDLRGLLDKQRRDSELKYSNLACRSFGLVARILPTRFEHDRLQEPGWAEHYAAPSTADLHARFCELSAAGQPEGLLAWMNAAASSHPLHEGAGLPPLSTLEGSANFTATLACALARVSPQHASAELPLILTEADPLQRARRVAALARAMALPAVATAADLAGLRPGSAMRNFLLGIALHWRFVTPAAGALEGATPFGEAAGQLGGSGEEGEGGGAVYRLKTWEGLEDAVTRPGYSTEHPVPEVVRLYLKASPSAVCAAFDGVLAKVRSMESVGVVATKAMMEAFAGMVGGGTQASASAGTRSAGAAADHSRWFCLTYDGVVGSGAADGTPLEAMEKADFDDCLALFKAHYPQLRLIYRHYSGYTCGGGFSGAAKSVGGGAGGGSGQPRSPHSLTARSAAQFPAPTSAPSTPSSHSDGSAFSFSSVHGAAAGWPVEFHVDDFLKLAVDCGVAFEGKRATGNSSDKTAVRDAFQHAQALGAAACGVSGAGEGDAGDDDDGDGGGGRGGFGGGGGRLKPAEFLVALMLLAESRVKPLRVEGAETVAGKLEQLLGAYILPEASYTEDSFVHHFSDDVLCRRVLEKRKADVLKVFRFYVARGDTAPGGAAGVLSAKDFQIFCTESKITDDSCAISSVNQVYATYATAIVSDSPYAQPVAGMDLKGFTAALCALAAFKHPSPYTPAHLRVQRLWTGTILGALQKKLKLTDIAELPQDCS